MLSALKYQVYDLCFSHPKESRFKTFFQELENKGNPKAKKNTKIILKKIMTANDKRTSIMVKNIPDNINEEQFQKIILSLCKNVNFCHITKNSKPKNNLKVAFINVPYHKQIISIYMGLLYKMKFRYNSPKMEIYYSKRQGKDRLTQKYCFNYKKSI